MASPAGAAPDGWHLTAEVSSGAAPLATAAAGAQEPGGSPPWKEAAEGVRTTVKWLVTALAAVGAVMFAKGFVTTPQLSWEDDTTQLVAAWVVGSLGVLGLGWLLYQAVQVLRPHAPELGNLPAGYVAMVDAAPSFYLPRTCDDVETFRRRLAALRSHAGEAARSLRQAQLALAEAIEAHGPSSPQAQEAQETLSAATASHDSIAEGLLVYERAKTDLLDRAGYWTSSHELSFSTGSMVGAAVLAAVGGIGYQLLLAAPDDAGEADPPSPPAVGELVLNDPVAGRALWDQLGLAGCQARASTPRIAVVVSSGKGTSEDPYTVSTLPARGCRAQTFTVVDAVARVSVPATVSISYTADDD